MSLNFYRRHLKTHEKGKALKAYLKMQGGKKQQGKRNPSTFSTMEEVAKELGIPASTANRQVKAAETYESLPSAINKKVDSGECPLEIAPQVVETIDKKTLLSG